MDSISFSGGLGNQLFQYAAAHSNTAQSNFKVDLHLYFIGSARKFELEELLQNCSHTNYIQVNFRSYSVTRLLESLKYSGIKMPVLDKLGYISDENIEALTFPKRRSRKNSYLSGMFQDAYLVEKVCTLIKPELDAVLVKRMKTLKGRFLIPDKYQLVHVRRSDYTISITPSEAIGQLSDEYFVGLTNESKLPIVLLSEDEKDIADLCSVLQPLLVLTKEQTDSWDVLALMTDAEILIGSNSTLSWWGAYLASKKGSVAWLPSQWSQWKNHDGAKLYLSAIHYPPSFWRLE